MAPKIIDHSITLKTKTGSVGGRWEEIFGENGINLASARFVHQEVICPRGHLHCGSQQCNTQYSNSIAVYSFHFSGLRGTLVLASHLAIG